MPRVSLVRLIILSCASLLANSALLRASPPAERFDQPDEPTARAIQERFADDAPLQAAHFDAQRAPGSSAAAATDARQIWPVLEGWLKIPLNRTTGAALPAQTVLLPENWGKGLERPYVAAWHLLRIQLTPPSGRQLWLRFDSVAHAAEIFVNGRRVGAHLGGYTPFALNVTDFVQPGENTVAVYVRDETAAVDPERKIAVSQVGVTRPGEWLSPGGITGGVWFELRMPVHVDRLSVHPSTRKNELRVRTHLAAGPTAGATVSHAVFAWPDGRVPLREFSAAELPPGTNASEVTVPWNDAIRWSPEHPNLYVLRTTVHAGEQHETIETRFGFREFWIEGRNFMLNGQPIRLRGSSLARDLETANTPDVGRAYGRAVFEFMKRELNFNAIRFHATIVPREAALAADEAGVLVVNQSALWSAMRGFYTNSADELLRNLEPQFAEWYWRDANSPSVVIWDVENEMIRDERTPERERWVLALDGLLKRLDANLIVEHSGDAWFAPDQSVIHLHMQEQYAEAIRSWQEIGRVPLVMGEFWVGGRGGEGRLTNGREYRGREDWLRQELALYRENMLEMRYHGVSGVMPFWLDRSLLKRTNETIRHAFDPAKDSIFQWAQPALRNFGAEGLAPVVAIIWPRRGSVAAGTSLAREVAICNDTEETQTLTVTAEFGAETRRWTTTLAPAAQSRHPVSFPASGSGTLKVSLIDASGRTHAGDSLAVHVIDAPAEIQPARHRNIIVMPAPSPADATALHELGVNYETASTIPTDAEGTLLLVPPGAAREALGRNPAAVQNYLQAGGRLLVLPQNARPEWLPASLAFWSASKKSAPEFTQAGWPDYTRHLMFAREIPLYAPGHPVFAGLTAEDFTWWADGDGRISDDTFARPSTLDLAAGAPYRVLAGCTRRENGALVEAAVGRGTAVFCQAQVLTQRAHPAARRLLINLLNYLDGPAWSTARQPIALAGDLTPARVAAITGLPATDYVPLASQGMVPAIVLAGAGADPVWLDRAAREGATVLVLSAETAGRLPGYAVNRDESLCYAGTRAGAADDPVFWGVAIPSFAPLARSPVNGGLSRVPADAGIALQGLTLARSRLPRESTTGARSLEMMNTGPAIAAIERRGKGRLIVTTIEPWNPAVESHRQLLATLLANAGLALPTEAPRSSVLSVKKTVPLRFDGRLGDWTNDMEDSAVSQFKHADPLVIGSQDAVSGQATGDLDQSGVLFLLHDARALYFGGIVFSASEPPQIEAEINGHSLHFDLETGKLAVDGRNIADFTFARGSQPANEIGDTRLLQLVKINPHINSMHSAGDALGCTFEAAVPWSVLGLAAVPPELQGSFQLSRSGKATLRQPIGAKQLLLRLEK